MDDSLPDQKVSSRDNAELPAPGGYDSWDDVTVHAIRIAVKNGLQPIDAADAAQQAIVNLIKSYWNAGEWELRGGTANSLLGRIAHSCAIDVHRLKRRSRDAPASPCVEDLATSDSRTRQVGHNESATVDELLAAAGLTEEELKVVYYRWLTHPPKTYVELAEMLARPVGGIRGLVNRAMAKLRNYAALRNIAADDIMPISELRLAADTNNNRRQNK